MDSVISAIALHCMSGIPITGEGTLTAHFPLYWTALLPPDDRRQVIVKETVQAIEVPKSEEGADILIERL